MIVSARWWLDAEGFTLDAETEDELRVTAERLIERCSCHRCPPPSWTDARILAMGVLALMDAREGGNS